MSKLEIQQRLKALEKTLIAQLDEGAKHGLERGTSFECGWHIGTIKAVIAELQSMQGK